MEANFLLGIFVFLFTTLEACIDISFISKISGLKYGIDFFQNIGLSIIFLSLLCKLAPIALITLHEILNSNYVSFKSKFENTSILKSKISGGFLYADVYYYAFHALASKLTFITTALTLGLYGFLEIIKNYINPFFEPFKNFNFGNLQLALLALICILLIDFSSYIKHYLSHRVGFLWDLHEFHHSPKEMTILSNFRNSPLSNALQEIAVLPLFILTGIISSISISSGFILPAFIFIMWNSFCLWTDVFGHCSVKMLFPSFIENLFMSPALHWIHHSSEVIHYDCNFGQRFAIWDKLFNTYYSKKGIRELKGYGVIGSEYNKYNPLQVYFWIPFKKIFVRLRTS